MDWGELLAGEDVDNLWDTYLNRIVLILNEMCPIKEINLTHLKEDWVTNEILEQVKLKNDLRAKARETGVLADWIKAQKSRNYTKDDEAGQEHVPHRGTGNS